MTTEIQQDLRRLPSVDRLLEAPEMTEAQRVHGHALTVEAIRAALEQARKSILEHGSSAPSLPELVAAARTRLEQIARPSLLPLINATGVIVHTNLGRAPLSAAARSALAEATLGYTNLEYDLEAGHRGSRYVHAEDLLCRLTGAEAALVVNNNAAAVFLALSELAAGREVIISRGQLVEIGGGFRIPDVLRRSGARLVEVGTTNRTHRHDYEQAIGQETAAIMRVHASNFKIIGFTTQVPLAELVELAHAHDLLLIDDLGSGTLLDTTQYGLAPEPTVQASVAAGADLVTFSGDKLLGGPQAGILVGRRDLIERLKRNPLTRALRVDKMTLSALQATLLHYLRGEAEQKIPTWRMIAAPLEALVTRAGSWKAQLIAAGVPQQAVDVVDALSAVGGGSLPGETLPTHALALTPPHPHRFAAALRSSQPPVIVRIEDDQIVLDPRTVLPEQDETLIESIVQAWQVTASGQLATDRNNSPAPDYG
ncbi:MAG TPA: L-seryl-tRNA(Sec) selenium transferase [Anaerolineae bacterium]|nr:L-seryl-tRNA(Sec) selenium transferase [Anaerolineae bacterium]